ncbi:hypothetical protein H634G_10306 [Metarhizium anisopliae BRIP 53293]|uniref:XPA C-terminal domain-containing protein n=1 Tax=Metarhizium anisopliae BRIP 53293 TaxID=1291518 RepID=A0A0D9NKA8_METAN|nr:hypothetical protein H634G_10306 [Metarhizium anisopliae BRIP 53293]KJK87736.1 hypothetical protein H633G_08399 [Metarhizium anisopliae BRIP 53284]
MERGTTAPPSTTAPVASPPTPEVTRRIEENRLRAKAIRDQREAEQRAAGKTSNTPKSAAGFVPTEHVHVSKPVNGKRLYSEISTQASSGMASGTNRDGRNKGDEEALRPARKFTKFVDYNMSSMTDTKGGFLTTEDDPHNYALGAKKPGQEDEQRPKDMTVQEWERMQLIRKLQRQKAGPFEPGISVLDDEEKRKKSELRDPELLPHLSKPNPHKSHWHDMMLFLRFQVEEYAVNTKWGSAEKLDAEYERREAQKKARKEAKFKEKLMDLKRKTRTDAFRRQAGTLGKSGANKFGDSIRDTKHVHQWGRTIENEEGMTIKTCVDCGMEVEELEL